MKSLAKSKLRASLSCLVAATLFLIAGPQISAISHRQDHRTEILPPLPKGSKEGFLAIGINNFTEGKSPSGPLSQGGRKTLRGSESTTDHTTQITSTAHSLCLNLTDDTGIERSISVRAGSEMRLSFRHSIYGSRIDEVFLLLPGGFELTKLRYGEARLVEFYGHESAQIENGVWIVTPTRMHLSSLNLRSSSDNAMSLHVDQNPIGEPIIIPAGGALRLNVAPCDQRADG